MKRTKLTDRGLTYFLAVSHSYACTLKVKKLSNEPRHPNFQTLEAKWAHGKNSRWTTPYTWPWLLPLFFFLSQLFSCCYCALPEGFPGSAHGSTGVSLTGSGCWLSGTGRGPPPSLPLPPPPPSVLPASGRYRSICRSLFIFTSLRGRPLRQD